MTDLKALRTAAALHDKSIQDLATAMKSIVETESSQNKAILALLARIEVLEEKVNLLQREKQGGA